MRIAGSTLNQRQREQVLSAYGYRWTIENRTRATNWLGSLPPPTIEPIPDAQWLAEHCFHFLKNGSRLSARHTHCEPVYMMGEEPDRVDRRKGGGR